MGHKDTPNKVEPHGDCFLQGQSSRNNLRHLDTCCQGGTAGQLSGAGYLSRFVTTRDEAAQPAFTAVVGRHGAEILGVCRRAFTRRSAAGRLNDVDLSVDELAIVEVGWPRLRPHSKVE